MKIDVNALWRDGHFDVDARRELSWTRSGQIARTLWTAFDCSRLCLHLFSRRPSGDGQWLPHQQTLKLTFTYCNYGGDRTWFLCPSCTARCAVLWGGVDFVCRQCCRLAYPSQRFQRFDLSIYRVHQVRAELGVGMDVPIISITRPRYMRYQRFGQLIHELIAAENIWVGYLIRKGMTVPETDDVPIDEAPWDDTTSVQGLAA